jgi:hypothetical protein
MRIQRVMWRWKIGDRGERLPQNIRHIVMYALCKFKKKHDTRRQAGEKEENKSSAAKKKKKSVPEELEQGMSVSFSTPIHARADSGPCHARDTCSETI